ncbi:MAG: hypothetical protein EXQ58_06630 [Acidobacteria bacterium]|nr:hypothetical protein [Acidobacteriota bacterium]
MSRLLRGFNPGGINEHCLRFSNSIQVQILEVDIEICLRVDDTRPGGNKMLRELIGMEVYGECQRNSNRKYT